MKNQPVSADAAAATQRKVGVASILGGIFTAIVGYSVLATYDPRLGIIGNAVYGKIRVHQKLCPPDSKTTYSDLFPQWVDCSVYLDYPWVLAGALLLVAAGIWFLTTPTSPLFRNVSGSRHPGSGEPTP